LANDIMGNWESKIPEPLDDEELRAILLRYE